MSETKPDASVFTVGDIVQHRASGDRAVVTGVHKECVVHPGMCSIRKDKSTCDFQPNGLYSLAVGFGHQHIGISGRLLEVVEKGQL